MLKKLKEKLHNNIIRDIYVTGYLYEDEEGINEFSPTMDYVYFKFDDCFIEIHTLNQEIKFELKVVHLIDYNYEIDEDMTVSKSTVGNLILDMETGNNIVSMRLYNSEEHKDSLICEAIELRLKNGQIIFCDALSYDGLNIGGHRKKEIWEYSLPEDKEIKQKNVDISDEWQLF
ncbi:hypothetical protein IW492_17165 [Enterococcus sp. BWB1-3]|uniref:hypothetical protein n=1 Tax=Enterococcus sp. BWB1-3 TaxID=2787713 RepID=UPI0019250034|nr:hypothetical protein [Enterococcus sp. BWB1-3]MBL1230959.1 hypothetical protein [Enterococcus sp. BWB1-3]